MKVMTSAEMLNTNGGIKGSWKCNKCNWGKFSYSNWCSYYIAKSQLSFHKWLFGHK